jgi:hypothetical protein
MRDVGKLLVFHEVVNQDVRSVLFSLPVDKEKKYRKEK